MYLWVPEAGLEQAVRRVTSFEGTECLGCSLECGDFGTRHTGPVVTVKS